MKTLTIIGMTIAAISLIGLIAVLVIQSSGKKYNHTASIFQVIFQILALLASILVFIGDLQ